MLLDLKIHINSLDFSNVNKNKFVTCSNLNFFFVSSIKIQQKIQMEEENYEESDREEELWKEVQQSITKKLEVLPQDQVFEEFEDLEEDVHDLSIRLLNENASPDLMPYRAYENLKNKIEEQRERAFDENLDGLERAILEMDSNRIYFELVSYNRLRFQKICKFPYYTLRERGKHMSLVEKEFGQEYLSFRNDYLMENVLKFLPEDFQSLETQYMLEPVGEVDIFPKPDRKVFVIFRALKNLGEIYPGQYIHAGQTFACPYEEIEPLLLTGDVILI